MADILQFPSQQTRGLAYLDRELRNLLAAKGADEALIDFAAAQLTSIYAEHGELGQHTFALQLPLGMDAKDVEDLRDQVNVALTHLRAENHRIIIQLIAQLVLAQVRIFQHERDQ